MEYYLRQPNGDLAEVASDRPGVGLTFRVARILPMTGIGADPTLTPEYKGLTDADTIADWRPPAGLTIDKKRVTKADEQYWSQHKGAPKVFVNLATAKKLWGTAFGDVTSLRLPADKAQAFEAALKDKIDPAALGMVFRAVKDQQLTAASGGTEFGGLFIGFSFFLLIAAVMLVAMLFRLSIEQRARQLGLLAACGFAPRQLRNMSLKEGLVLAIVGGVLGTALAVGYTALMIHGLRTWWVGAIGTTALRLYVVPATLAGGFAGSVIVALLAVLWAVRRVGKASPASLLAGALGTSAVRLAKPARKSLIVAALGVLGAIAMFAAGGTSRIDQTGAFLGGGSLLLLAALLVVFARLRPSHRAAAQLSVPGLAVRNATRNRTRSLLCVALIALASFTLVTVSSMESSTPGDTFDRHSGAGGYGLIVQTDIPLFGDLNTLKGREVLMRLPSARDPRWEKARFVMMRKWAGQDISCLNITRPDSPTILSVPGAFTDNYSKVHRGRFDFATLPGLMHNPWDALDQPQPDDDTIPVIADDESAKYIMHLDVGDTLTIHDATGRPRKLKLVATLAGSIFQSEMLMSEANFLKLFPAQGGFSTVLVDTTPTDLPQVEQLLRDTLNDPSDKEGTDYSATIETTAARLDAYHQVANTYLSTFRVLGSLGLMLGTIGLAVVLVRNLIERRPELALLSALGFDPSTRTRLVLWENVSLLLLGLLIGAGCALAGVIPNVLTTAHTINVPALLIALAAVLVVGLTSLVIAVRVAGRRVTPAALRAE
jgi:ABC-type antimicrobial peptide transport system permease subunit